MNNIKKKSVLVVGDLMIDHYLWGNCKRISPEAPVQVIDIASETTTLGGAGNVVNNLISLDCDVTIFSVIGDDENGKELIKILESKKIKHYLISDENRKTTKKSRIISSKQQIVRYDSETIDDISKECEKNLSLKIISVISQFDIVLISDYGKGVITKNLMNKISFASFGQNIKILVDPKGKDYSKYIGSYLITPNRNEATLATGINICDNKSLKEALKKLKNIASLEIAMITLSEKGIAILDENNHLVIYPTVTKDIYDVTGAGDTVIASLCFSLLQNNNIDEAIKFANLAAGIAVGKIGSSTVTLDEIEDYKATIHQSDIEYHIKSIPEIEKTVKRLKNLGKKIIFTNGCFDILHRGHISYLSKAKSYGDILIVGLNSDDSVRRLKGKTRPINSEDDRAFVLAGLESVDYVVKFREDTPFNLIKIIKPDILVKGGDYKGKEVIGSDIVDEVKLIDFIDGHSTTNIIKSLQKTS